MQQRVGQREMFIFCSLCSPYSGRRRNSIFIHAPHHLDISATSRYSTLPRHLLHTSIVCSFLVPSIFTTSLKINSRSTATSCIIEPRRQPSSPRRADNPTRQLCFASMNANLPETAPLRLRLERNARYSRSEKSTTTLPPLIWTRPRLRRRR